VCRCLWNNLSHIPLGISLGVGLLDRMADLCLVFLRSLHIVFHADCTSLHSHQQCRGFLFPPASSPTFVVGSVVDDGYSNRTRWNFSVVLICISFMARDGEHFFMWFLAIWISSLEKFCLVQLPTSLLVHRFWGNSVFLSSLYILVISPLMYS
jgi:hypothetical protein